jgi:gas vesicle protein
MKRFESNGNDSLGLPLFLAGLGAGIAVTLLFAPRSGVATRRLIGGKVKDGQDWVKDKAAAAEDYVLSQGTEIRDRVKKVAELVGRA